MAALAADLGVVRTFRERAAMPDAMTGLFTRWMRVIGWFCALGIALLIYDLVTFLPYLPDCWYPEQRPPYNASDMQFKLLRVISIDFGLAWLGQWGYLGALVWIPFAIVRGLRGWRRRLRARPDERVLFVLICTLVVATSALVHLTLRRSRGLIGPCLPEISTAESRDEMWPDRRPPFWDAPRRASAASGGPDTALVRDTT